MNRYKKLSDLELMKLFSSDATHDIRFKALQEYENRKLKKNFIKGSLVSWFSLLVAALSLVVAYKTLNITNDQSKNNPVLFFKTDRDHNKNIFEQSH